MLYFQHATWERLILQKILKNVQNNWLKRLEGMYFAIPSFYSAFNCCIDNLDVDVCVYTLFSNHTEIRIDNSITSTVNIFTETTGLTPKFKVFVIKCMCTLHARTDCN